MSRKILNSINLDDPALAGNREFLKAVCQIARVVAEPETEARARAWHASQGELLQTSTAEVRFFGDQAVARLTEEGLRIELRNARGEVHAVEPGALPLSLAPLKRQLQNAAIDRIGEIRYAAIEEKAGLPLAQVHQVLRLGRDDDSKKLAGRLAGDLTALLNQALAAIRQLLTPEEIELAKAIVRGEQTLASFNLAYKHRVVLRQLMKEAPQLVPLLVRAMAEKRDFTLGLDAYKQLKEHCRAAGYGEGVWKFLVKMPAPTIKWLADRYALSQVFDVVAMLAETGQLPPQPLVQVWASGALYNHCFLPPLWFRRAAAAHAQSLKSDQETEQFVVTEYVTALNWLITRAVAPDVHQARAGWAWIKRQAEAWQEEVRLMGRQKTWYSLVAEYTDGAFTVVPLTTSTALRDEGKRMRHCVGNYDSACMDGSYRVFSIREPSTGKAKATAAIYLSGNKWQLTAVQGNCNRPVTRELRHIADRLAEKYDAAWQQFMAGTSLPEDAGNP
jgi:hypothetical protein